MDIKSAFLQGETLTREVIVQPPRGYELAGKLWRLRKCLYGLNDAARAFYMSVKHTLVELGCQCSELEPAMYLYQVNGVLHGFLLTHVDDFLNAGDEMFEERIIRPLSEKYHTSRQESTCFKYVGIGIVQESDQYLADSVIPTTFRGASRDLTSEEYFVFRSLVGKINWLATSTRPEVSFQSVDLSTKFAHATTTHLNDAAQTVRKLKLSEGHLVYPRLSSIQDVSLTVFADASLANLENSGSCGGHLIFMTDSYGKSALVAWHSGRIKRVCRSTLAAETLAMSNALEEAVYLREIIQLSTAQTVPVLAVTDNRSLLQAVESTSLVLEKRLRIEVSAIKELVERSNVTLKWTPGQYQLADSMTKKVVNANSLLQPKKPPGPPANLRPITLKNSIRKILSTVALHRIRDKTDNFTGSYQSGFKRGRSCADIVWAQRMLVSVVMSKHWDFHKMGIDMSRAFDTIKRSKILEVLDQAGCNNDELRLVRLLLSGTKLKVRVRSTHSADFETSIGSPQGDSLSPVLFTCYLVAALETVRRSSARPNQPVSELGMPLEMEYADDVDFLDEEKAPLERLLPVAARNLKDSNLFVNEGKTEFTHVYLDDKPQRGEEEWRKSKILGSLLCSSADIEARCIMGNIAFRFLCKIWIRRSRIPLTRKLQLYNACCVSIMLYNCNSWAAPRTAIQKLDICHRKHLRAITGLQWPRSRVTNDTLYKVCNTEPLSVKVEKLRWSLFGHILRMLQDTPAQKALEFSFLRSKRYKARRGRHCINLFSQLKGDLKCRGLEPPTTEKKLKELRELARQKTRWKEMKKD
ncbi:hypothetical protein Bbelb_025010 [Branchiostoma belcheri]|nr:hypothetical protein Bbelb_025010 [Branchiostoma belcheri]